MQHVFHTTQNKTPGNSIILFLPFVAVFAAIVQLSLLQSNRFTATINNFRNSGVRDSLVSNMRSYSSLPATFRSSLQSANVDQNPDLQNCVFGTGPNLCKAGFEMPVTLYSPASSSMIISGPASLNGTPTQAALYDIKGNICKNTTGAATAQCPFEVTTSFVATCAGGASSCSTAQSLAVHYNVKRINNPINGQTSILRAMISQTAPSIDVTRILPATSTNNTGNVKVSSLTNIVNGAPNDSLSSNIALIKEIIPGGDDAKINQMAQTFLANGYTDAGFIKAIAQSVYVGDKIPLIETLHQVGVTDANEASFLLQVGINDSGWWKILVDSGTTNVFYATQLYTHVSVTTGAQYNAIVNSVVGLPEDSLSAAIASTAPLSPSAASQMYSQISSYTTVAEVGAGLIYGGWSTDAVKSQAIASALAGVPPDSAFYMAQQGITDAALASNLSQIVSAIPFTKWAADVIRQGGGDPGLTQSLTEGAVAVINGSTVSTAVTTTSTGSGETPTSLPSEMPLISTCTTCAPLSF